MHKVAESTTLAGTFLVLAALGFPKISDWRVLSHDHPVAVVAPVHTLHAGLCLGLVLVFEVDVADHMVTDVVRNDHLFDLAELGHLHEHLLVVALEVLNRINQVLLRHVATVSEGDRRVRILVHVLEAKSLRHRWLVVDASTGIPMATRSYLEVERTVDFILFCAENTLKSLCHLK